MTNDITTNLSMTDDSEGVQASQEESLSTRSASVGVNIDVNVVDLIELIGRSIEDGSVEGRRAFVMSLRDKINSETQGKANIMIFNRRQICHFNPNWETTRYSEAPFKGILYGAWIFTGGGTFVSEGEYGYENWGFYGWFDYDKPNKTVHFRQV
ncbi:MAG: hypothetical protein VKN72_12530 [Nostocales cyanobacterium 94392]|nr:hypothetical protein [Nostocales cyanobacterium 94392]